MKKLEFLKNNVTLSRVEELAPLGCHLSWKETHVNDMKKVTVTGYKECDYQSCGNYQRGTCTVDRMRVITDNANSWCLDVTELKYFRIIVPAAVELDDMVYRYLQNRDIQEK